MEIRYVFPDTGYSITPNPVHMIHGKIPEQVIRLKPAGWRLNLLSSKRGWIMIDEMGNERIRYMLPVISFARNIQLNRLIKNGYWIIRDSRGNYLDGKGQIIAPNIPPHKLSNSQLYRIHIPASSVYSEAQN